MDEVKEVLLNATKEAGKIILQYFDGIFKIDHKEGINNLVTEVDKLSEDKIIKVIRATFPTHRFPRGLPTKNAPASLHLRTSCFALGRLVAPHNN